MRKCDQELAERIGQFTAGSMNGTMSFPEVVGSLLEANVAMYQVDLVRSVQICYLRSDESVVVDLDLAAIEIGQEFDAAEVRAAVLSSQTEGQAFVDFVRRVKQAGCIGYFAYLDGRKVVYYGRLGDTHTEHFPQ